jgi:hypothetical protein
MKTTVEAQRKKNDIVQRTRCRHYGHTKTYCARLYTCVKCRGKHNTTLCKENPNTLEKCALCRGNQPANYKGSDIYKNLQKESKQQFNHNEPSNLQKEAKQQFNHNEPSRNHITQILTLTIITNFL